MPSDSMQSESFRHLSERLNDLDDLNRAHLLFTQGRPGRQWFTVPLNRSAVVLLCAHFEGFLEEFFKECVACLSRSSVSTDRIPRKLRVVQLEGKLGEVTQAQTRQERLAKLDEVFAVAEPLWTPGRQIAPHELDATHVTEGFSNPWIDRILWMFDFLDVKPEVSEISWRSASKRSVRSNVNAMVETRNKIAHGKVGVTIRKADVTRYRRYVTGYAKALDRILSRKLQSITGKPPW